MSNPPSRAETPTSQSPLQAELPDIRVEYHPNSKRPPKTSTLEDFRFPDGPPDFTPAPGASSWTPFVTRSDYQFTQIALEASLNQRQVAGLCDIIQRCLAQEDTFSFKTPADLERRLNNAAGLVPGVSPHIFIYSNHNLNV